MAAVFYSNYEFLGESMAKAGLVDETDEIHVFLTDGVQALIQGLRSQVQFRAATHLRCELHLRENVETKLKNMGATEVVRKVLLKEIFGSETREKDHISRKAGNCF